MRDGLQSQALARTLVERMTLLWQAALLCSDASNPAAEYFIESRIGGRWGARLERLARRRATLR